MAKDPRRPKQDYRSALKQQVTGNPVQYPMPAQQNPVTYFNPYAMQPNSGMPSMPSVPAPNVPGAPTRPTIRWSRAYAAPRTSDGQLLGTYNAYGQPVGTPAPTFVRSPRRDNVSARLMQPGEMTPERMQATIAELEKQLQDEYARLDRANPNGLTWDPLQYRLKRIQQQLGIYRKRLERMGGASEAGVTPGEIGQLVRWNP